MPPRSSARQSAHRQATASSWLRLCLDQARIDRKPLTADQPGRDALRYHGFENLPQGVALAKALMPRAAEH